MIEGNDNKATGRIELGSDVDNIHLDTAAKRVFIGYGIDASTRRKIGDIPLKVHPEGFKSIYA